MTPYRLTTELRKMFNEGASDAEITRVLASFESSIRDPESGACPDCLGRSGRIQAPSGATVFYCNCD